MITYEKLSKKNAIGGSQKPPVNVLIQTLNELNADTASPLYGKLGKYAAAIRTITEKSNRTKRQSDVNEVKAALATLAGTNGEPGLEDFLLQGEGKSNYELIIEGVKKNGGQPADIDEGLEVFSKFTEMGLNLNELHMLQNKRRSSDKDLQDDGRALTDARVFEKRTAEGMTFAGDIDQRPYVDRMYNILADAENALSTKIEAAQDNRGRLKQGTSAEKKKEYENNVAFYEQLHTYKEAIRTLKADPDLNEFTTEAKAKALNDLKNFQAFLEEGPEQTNLKQIIDLAHEINIHSKKSTLENTFSNGLNKLEGTLHFGLDAEKAQEIKPEYKAQLEQKKKEEARIQQEKASRGTAAEWLNQYKRRAQAGSESLRKRQNYPQDYFARIMAVRDIAEVERNQPSKLMRHSMSLYEINQRMEVLKEGTAFKGFLDKLATDKNLLAKAEKAAANGHCGGVDDMLKDYVKNLPAGELQNDPALKRFMPTVKDRIEALQEQASQCMKKGEKPYMQVAEIVVLRNMIKAERDYKSGLEVKIPVDERKLAEEVKKLAGRKNFQRTVDNPNVLNKIKKGHGGLMLNEMRNTYTMNAEMGGMEETKQQLLEGTIEGRLKEIQTQAGELKAKIDKLYKAHKNGRGLHDEEVVDLLKQSRELIAEDIALNRYFEANTKVSSADNVPWRKINKLKAGVIEEKNLNEMLYGKDALNPYTVMDRLGQLNQSENIHSFYQDRKEEAEKFMKKKLEGQKENQVENQNPENNLGNKPKARGMGMGG